MLFGLPAGIRPPVLVESFEMRNAARLVPLENQFLELWNGNPQDGGNSPESSVKSLLGRSCQLLEEVATKRVPDLPHGPVGFSH